MQMISRLHTRRLICVPFNSRVRVSHPPSKQKTGVLTELSTNIRHILQLLCGLQLQNVTDICKYLEETSAVRAAGFTVYRVYRDMFVFKSTIKREETPSTSCGPYFIKPLSGSE